MKRAGLAILGIGLLAFAGTPALAGVDFITGQFNNGISDTNYDSNTGIWSFVENIPAGPPIFPVSVSEASTMGGFTPTSVNITAEFDSVQLIDGDIFAKFINGTIDLEFSTHNFEGSAAQLFMSISSSSRIDIEGVFIADQGTLDLPLNPTGDWDDGGGFSSLDGLTIFTNQDVSDFDWETEDFTGGAETQFTLFPDDRALPEPTTLALLALGGIAAIRRRR